MSIIFKFFKREIQNIIEKDPAVKSKWEVLLYPSLYALSFHRVSHFLYQKKFYFLARLLSQIARFLTGIEIHPGAQLGKCIFFDHGMGIVIGETAIIGDHCVIFHGVTLGGLASQQVKRHPTIGSHVMIGAGAKLLGNIEVGDYAKIGANAVLRENLPAYAVAVGIPARILKQKQSTKEKSA